jgi:hypothetical protein
MAKNLTKSVKQPVAMEKNSTNVESLAASTNMTGSAYDMPLENNAKRASMQHEGAMPIHNPNGLQ